MNNVDVVIINNRNYVCFLTTWHAGVLTTAQTNKPTP
jgi:hypothetical protein